MTTLLQKVALPATSNTLHNEMLLFTVRALSIKTLLQKLALLKKLVALQNVTLLSAIICLVKVVVLLNVAGPRTTMLLEKAAVPVVTKFEVVMLLVVVCPRTESELLNVTLLLATMLPYTVKLLIK